MSKILVTGVAGFIGAKTAELLLEQGNTVVGIDSLNAAYDVRLKQKRVQHLMLLPNFSFHLIDITDAPSIIELVQGRKFDAIIHLAGRAGVRYSMENPYIYMAVNAQGTLNVLEAMRLAHIPKIVLASTSSLYAGQQLPFKETLPVNEPISVYAASKKAAEVMCYTFHHLFKIDVSIVRYFTVYGPAGRPDMSPFRFIKWMHESQPIELFGDGSQSRDFTYIDDIARGTIAALKPVGCETFNLGGGGEPRSLVEMIKIIEDIVGLKATLVQKDFHRADMLETQADIQKARDMLCWEPTVKLEEGIARTVEWYRANYEWTSTLAI